MTHWRRHEEAIGAVMSGEWAANVSPAAAEFAATACGRLVDYQQAVGDPTEADCPECIRIAALEQVSLEQAKLAAKYLLDAFDRPGRR